MTRTQCPECGAEHETIGEVETGHFFHPYEKVQRLVGTDKTTHQVPHSIVQVNARSQPGSTTQNKDDK